MWGFLLLFPLLFGHPVNVYVTTTTEKQCNQVRDLLVQQLADHHSNATVNPCTERK